MVSDMDARQLEQLAYPTGISTLSVGWYKQSKGAEAEVFLHGKGQPTCVTDWLVVGYLQKHQLTITTVR